MHTELATIDQLSFDENVCRSVSESKQQQYNFDKYAELFQTRHPDMIRPASCDGLNAIKHCERLFFVEYKNGNVVAKNGQTNEITLKSKPATNIEKKLYDSVLMLKYEGLINLAVSRNQCIALVVVRNDAVPRSEAEADSLQPTANPVFPQLMRTADEFNIRSAAGLAEKLAFRCLVWVSGSGGWWCWSGSLGVWIPRRCSPPPCNCLTRGGCRAWSSVTRRTADGNCISRSGSRRVRGSPARNRGAARPRVCFSKLASAL